MSILKKGLFLFLFFFGFVCFPAFAQFDIPPKPDMQTSVYDYAQMLSATEKSALEQKLIHYSDTTSTQIVIATTPTIKGENIGLLTPKWAHEWGVGQAEEDNGVFILLAAQEREIWISPGYGLEQKLTAGINGEIIRNIIIPEFKKGDYYAGLDKGTDALIDVFKGTYKGTRKSDNNNPSGGIIFLFLLFIIIIIILSNSRGRGGGNRGRRSGGVDLWDMIILSNLGRGSGGFGSGSSGGGFGGGGFGGGFGGGGFSGGGAGGSW